MIGKKLNIPPTQKQFEILQNQYFQDQMADDEENNQLQINSRILHYYQKKNNLKNPTKLSSNNFNNFDLKRDKYTDSAIKIKMNESKKSYRAVIIIFLLFSILCVSLFVFKMVLEINVQHHIISAHNKDNNVLHPNQQDNFSKSKQPSELKKKILLSNSQQNVLPENINPQHIQINKNTIKVPKRTQNLNPMPSNTHAPQQIKTPIAIKPFDIPKLPKGKVRIINGKLQMIQNQIQDIAKDAKNISPNVQNNFQLQCQSYISNILSTNGNLYQFISPYNQILLNSRVQNYVYNVGIQISKEQYLEAIDLLFLIHRVGKSFDIVLDESPCENTETKRERLLNAVYQRYTRWNEKYEINKYHSKQLKFCIVVNSYNNGRNGLIYRNIDSILQQNYTNYHVVYHDDASTDSTGQKVKDYLLKNEVPEDKFKVEINPLKVGMMANIYKAMMTGCNEGEIAVMLDGDDSLIGIEVLSLLNAVYQKQKLALVWANFVWINGNNRANMGYSRAYTQAQIQVGIRHIQGFISTHLKTFFVDVFRKIKIEDLQDNRGQFYGGASDNAIMIPMIELATPKFRYLPEILYQYRYDTGQVGNSVNAGPQREAIEKIYSSQPYQSLKDFSFIDSAIQNVLQISTN